MRSDWNISHLHTLAQKTLAILPLKCYTVIYSEHNLIIFVCRPEMGHAPTCVCSARRISPHTKEKRVPARRRGEEMITKERARCLKGNAVTDRARRSISNSEIPRLETYITPAISISGPFLIAKIRDFRRPTFSASTAAGSIISNRLCCRLKSTVTPCKQTIAAISNRRKTATFAFLQNSSPLATRRHSCYSESSILPQHLTVLPEQTDRLARRFQSAPRFLLVRRLRRNLHGYRSDAQDF
jgi:hypothetical protein